MKTTELTKGIPSSIIGFGCAPILGSVDGDKARRAIECALDCGVTHFDIARSYGYGEAEKFVGQVLGNRRSQVVLASKFGIMANWKAAALRPLKPLIRAAKDARKKGASARPAETTPAPPTAANAGVADRFHDRIPLTGANMRGSLEKSLSALGTDYLDYFFIHEPHDSLTHLDELCATAEALKAEGKIRAWGLAYMRAKEPVHQAYLNRFDVLQFDNSPGAPGYDKVVSERGALPNLMFSPLRGGSTDLSPAEKMSKLFVDFPLSVVLCSMYSEKHIRQNVEIANRS